MADSYLKSLLGANEQIIFVTRQHWSVLLVALLSGTFFVAVLAALITLVWRFWLPNPYVRFGYVLLLFPLLNLLRDILVWSHLQYVVTNWRVIQIFGVFSKDVTDSSLEKVNDVKLEQSLLGRILDYGNVEILTASELGVNKFRRVGHPIGLKIAMLNAKEKLEHGSSVAASRSEVDIVDLIAQLDNLRKNGVLSEEEFQRKKTQLLSKI